MDAAHAGQYFEAQPATPSAPRAVQLALPDRTLQLRTDRGVFSYQAIDPGTRYLLQEAELPREAERPGRHLLDLGCGYGPIAVTLALRCPGATVWAVDVNGRAVDLTRRNADAQGLSNVRPVLAADPEQAEAAGLGPDLRFAAIWSNPPIRIGKAALHAMLGAWLDRLAPGGRACLVVQKHLGADSLARWLDDQGWATTRRSSRAGYRLLDVAPR